MEKALKFLESKGITKLTCYTDTKKIYYIHDLAKLLEEYKTYKEPKQIVPPIYRFIIINDVWYLINNVGSNENVGYCIDSNNNIVLIQQSNIERKTETNKIIASSQDYDDVPMIDIDRILSFLVRTKNINDIHAMVLAVSNLNNDIVTYTSGNNRFVLINSIIYK
jgi:hypothetical protein